MSPLSLSHATAESLAPGESATAVMGINFCDSTQAANFQLWYVFISRWGRTVGGERWYQNKLELEVAGGGAMS